jgi:hypothetical protein
MDLEITPEPTPAEREAIERALTALSPDAEPSPRREWWRAGVEEAVGLAPEDDLEPQAGQRAS